MALRAFLTRNAQPFTYEDVETDPAVQALLDRFQITPDEVPVVICAAGTVFRNPSIERLATELGLAPELDAEATSSSWARGPAAWPPRSTPPPRA